VFYLQPFWNKYLNPEYNMNKHQFCSNLLIIFLLLSSCALVGQIIYGTNNYIEYHPGTLPIVISVPHGGLVAPAGIPNRTCNNPTTGTDTNTIELAKQIDSSFLRMTGCRPHIIYCNLRRTKIDCNRNLADGACGNAEAEIAWTEFHEFIETAQETAQTAYDNKAIYFDLHGHGHIMQRLELGYVLTGAQLGLSDNVLNTPEYIGQSSIQNLVGQNVNGYTHAQLLRGDFALGTLLAQAGYPAVPSQQTPNPGPLNPYFNGGYNTVNYTCYTPGNTINGFQLECNFMNVRDTPNHRRAFADTLVAALLTFLEHHHELSVAYCGISGQESAPEAKSPTVYPTFLDGDTPIQINGVDLSGKVFRIFGITGQLIASGKVKSDNTIVANGVFSRGMYVLVVDDEKQRHAWKLLK